MASSSPMGAKFRFGMVKSSGNGWWGRLHNTVDVFNATEVYAEKMATTVNVM